MIRALQCTECSRYVCNAMQLHSKCSDCCELDVVTTEIELHEEHDDLGMCLGTCLKGVKEEDEQETTAPG